MNLLHAPRLAGRGLVKVYRYTLSPLIGFHCRHLPTCSEYADEALDRYGLWAGSWITLAPRFALSSLGHVGHRPRARHGTAGRALVRALALRPMVLGSTHRLSELLEPAGCFA